MFIYRVALDLFGEGASGEGNASAVAAQGSGGESSPAVAAQGEVKTTSDTLDERRKAYRQMVDGEYKDLYTEDTQRIIDRRFKETKQMKSLLDSYKPIIDTLTDRYGESDLSRLIGRINDDRAFWESAAAEAGFDDVEKYKEFQRLRRENAEYERATKEEQGRKYAEQRTKEWIAEADALKAKYPSFDFEAEMKDQSFVRSIQNGVPMEVYFRGKYYDALLDDAVSSSVRKTEKAVADNIRARGARPAENGSSPSGGYQVTSDVGSLTREQRLELVKKARSGEVIKF